MQDKLHTQLTPLWGFVFESPLRMDLIESHRKLPTEADANAPIAEPLRRQLTVKILIRARVAFYHRRDARAELIFDKDTKRLKPIYKVNKRLLERPERGA